MMDYRNNFWDSFWCSKMSCCDRPVCQLVWLGLTAVDLHPMITFWEFTKTQTNAKTSSALCLLWQLLETLVLNRLMSRLSYLMWCFSGNSWPKSLWRNWDLKTWWILLRAKRTEVLKLNVWRLPELNVSCRLLRITCPPEAKETDGGQHLTLQTETHCVLCTQ